MEAAVLDKVGVDVTAKQYTFRATGQTIKFAGFMKVYMESYDSEEEGSEDKENILPVLNEGERAELRELLPNNISQSHRLDIQKRVWLKNWSLKELVGLQLTLLQFQQFKLEIISLKTGRRLCRQRQE